MLQTLYMEALNNLLLAEHHCYCPGICFICYRADECLTQLVHLHALESLLSKVICCSEMPRGSETKPPSASILF